MKRTRLPNVTSVLSRRGNEYCVSCLRIGKVFFLRDLKPKIILNFVFIVNAVQQPTDLGRLYKRAHWLLGCNCLSLSVSTLNAATNEGASRPPHPSNRQNGRGQRVYIQRSQAKIQIFLSSATLFASLDLESRRR